MGKFGRDPEFLKEVKVPVGEFIFNKAGEHLQSVYAQNNFILRYNLTGNFGNLLPHYLQKENYDLVKTNLHKLKIKEGYAEAAFEEYGRFDAMNLSNIFEYMPMDLFKNSRAAYSQHQFGRQASLLEFNGSAQNFGTFCTRSCLS